MKFEITNTVKTGRAFLLAAALAGSGPILAACAGDSTDAATEPATADLVLAATSQTVDQADIDNLLFMRQEEKLAADVYNVLYDQWGLRPFANIEQAELTHQAEVSAVLASLGIEDPIDALAPGEFIDPALQDLYDDLVERGMISAQEALMVGALIEEVDIADLRQRASEVPEIDALYARLEAGSNNHLRAFVRSLEGFGVEYDAQVLETADVAAIVAADNTMGHEMQGQGVQGQGGHGQGGLGQGQGMGQGQGGQGMGQGHGRGRS